LPISSGTDRFVSLVKPWVKNYRVNLLGQGLYDEIIMVESE